jgi:hypothetical protein
VLALVALMAFVPACEDTDVTAPSGSTITVTPAGPVVIDQYLGETEDETALVVQVVDPNGLPVDDLPLFFTSTGGLLGSLTNFCRSDGSCARSGDPCNLDGDCPVPSSSTVTTNESGVAVDFLRLRLFGDPSQVTVTAKGTNLEGSATVDKIINLGAADPVPVILAQPATGQRTGLPFKFNATSSVFDPNVEPECYDWKITSNLKVFNAGATAGCVICPTPGSPVCATQCVARGPDSVDAIVELTIGTEGDQSLDQTLSVTLRVSDDPTINCDLVSYVPAVDDPKFGPNIASVNYDIDCDTTDPSANAGSDFSVSLSGDGIDGVVAVSLNGSGSDPEDVPPLEYSWNCGSGGVCSPAACDTQSVTCEYASQGFKTAVLTVRNDCGREDTDTVQITVQP